ncbi:MAG: phosphotransferase family protein [Cycloclasticus sp.]|nr:MAG: phosphotransferase family protein [Cycloclasticus sp.]
MIDFRLGIENYLLHLGKVDTVEITNLCLLSGGAIQQNWLLDVTVNGAPLETVLRTDSASSLEDSLSRAQEYAVFRQVFDAGVTVPEPLWLSVDPQWIGKPFFIMRRVAGTAAGHKIVRNAAMGGGRKVLANRLGRELARTHTIKYGQAELDFLSRPAPTPALYCINEYRAALDASDMPQPTLEWGLYWLEQNAPEAVKELVLCHNDFRTGNYMVTEQSLTGVLDWEFAAWGDPMVDIGWFCAKCWRFGAVQNEAGGISARADFYSGYEAVSGEKIDRKAVLYWEVMAAMRWAIIAIKQGDRHISGREPSLELALTRHIVPELELDIMHMTQEADNA